MSYYVIKDIKMNRKTNKISANIADSSLRDYNDNLKYSYCDDLFAMTKGATFEDKKAFLFFNIITGVYHCNRYKNLVCTFDYFEGFVAEVKDALINSRINDLSKIYYKYKADIDEWLKKDCIVRNISHSLYVTRINKRSISLNNRHYATIYNSKYIEHRTSLLKNGYEIEKI